MPDAFFDEEQWVSLLIIDCVWLTPSLALLAINIYFSENRFSPWTDTNQIRACLFFAFFFIFYISDFEVCAFLSKLNVCIFFREKLSPSRIQITAHSWWLIYLNKLFSSEALKLYQENKSVQILHLPNFDSNFQSIFFYF